MYTKWYQTNVMQNWTITPLACLVVVSLSIYSGSALIMQQGKGQRAVRVWAGLVNILSVRAERHYYPRGSWEYLRSV